MVRDRAPPPQGGAAALYLKRRNLPAPWGAGKRAMAQSSDGSTDEPSNVFLAQTVEIHLDREQIQHVLQGDNADKAIAIDDHQAA